MPKDFDNVVPHTKLRSLRGALRRVRLAQAEQTDVLSDLQEAQHARLEIVLEALKNVLEEIPQEEDQFLFQITPGTAPRLWIDVTSHVLMARDQKTYRFLKDTRLGRVVLLETPEAEIMADALTEYVAERMIERARALDTDWLIDRSLQRRRGLSSARLSSRSSLEEEDEHTNSLPPSSSFTALLPFRSSRKIQKKNQTKSRARRLWPSFFVFLIFIGGILLGISGLIVYAWLVTMG